MVGLCRGNISEKRHVNRITKGREKCRIAPHCSWLILRFHSERRHITGCPLHPSGVLAVIVETRARARKSVACSPSNPSSSSDDVQLGICERAASYNAVLAIEKRYAGALLIVLSAWIAEYTIEVCGESMREKSSKVRWRSMQKRDQKSTLN